MFKIILASASPRRVELLKLLKLDFDIMPAGIDETTNGFIETGKYAMEMSRKKALWTAEKIHLSAGNDTIVIGADTVVDIDGRILGKPADKKEAEDMLKMLENRWHEVTTGVTLVNPKTMEAITEKEVTRVKISKYPRGFLERYIASGEPFDKAGSYGVQGLASLIVERIEGCYFNVVGLPLYRLSRMLESMGCRVLSWI
ncbi:MAG: septum formation protein Maf [Clostridiaceae bacterium]|nr:septum formation protein Maf [Clostridiaceae bacterium]